uniref:Uncharacterized protein n=1 Tax=Bionectria ochroleuca TaxID=29856 RepID=A0A8H7K2M1_BIOOC
MAAVIRIPPFGVGQQIVQDTSENGQYTIPNAPLASLEYAEVHKFLGEDLVPARLNELYPYLVLVAKKSGTHISPLSEHVCKGRELIVTEDPAMHLVWYYKAIYLKPIPHCLLNFKFWELYLSPAQKDKEYRVDELSDACRSALGFLRGYIHLIRHESDFLVAQQKHLVPKGAEFRDFQLFINAFATVSDEATAPRYHYGQIRLSRLNCVVWLFPPRSWHYYQLDWQIGDYFTRWAPPLLFIWASTNLILSSMQVVHNSRGMDTWAAFNTASWIFALVVLILLAFMLVLILGVLACVYGSQLLFAIGTIKEIRRIGEVERDAEIIWAHR